MQRLKTLPGVGVILAATIALEMGCRAVTERGATGQLCGNDAAGARQRGRVRYGRTRPDVDRYLKWAFSEAANSVAVNYKRCPERHVSELYARLHRRKGHHTAVGAVARHSPDSAFHVLSRQQEYRDPAAVVGRTSEV